MKFLSAAEKNQDQNHNIKKLPNTFKRSKNRPDIANYKIN